jgi:hypothetical protein
MSYASYLVRCQLASLLTVKSTIARARTRTQRVKAHHSHEQDRRPSWLSSPAPTGSLTKLEAKWCCLLGSTGAQVTNDTDLARRNPTLLGLGVLCSLPSSSDAYNERCKDALQPVDVCQGRYSLQIVCASVEFRYFIADELVFCSGTVHARTMGVCSRHNAGIEKPRASEHRPGTVHNLNLVYILSLFFPVVVSSLLRLTLEVIGLCANAFDLILIECFASS